MKKRILACMLAVCLLAMSACGALQKVGAFALVDSAVNKSQALESYEMDMDMDMKVKVSGQEIDVPMHYLIRVADAKTNPVASSDFTMELFGSEMKGSFYADSEYAYIDMMGQKMKISMANSMAKQYANLREANALVQELPEDLLANVQTVDNADGTKTVSVDIPKELFQSIFGEYAKSLTTDSLSSLIGDDGEQKVDVDNIHVDVTVREDGYIGQYNMRFDMAFEMDAAGTSTPTDIHVDIKAAYVDPGKTVTVTAPDLSGYQEYSLPEN